MEPEFWHNKWEKREIGFHEGEPNKLLTKHFEQLRLNRGSRIFVPLCGKTRDISWFLSHGLEVVGAELNEAAVLELFEEAGFQPLVKSFGALKRYSSGQLQVFVGDIFDLATEHLGQVDLVYDRAAMVALPPDMRARYAAHLMDITATSAQFLITYEYDQSEMDGPPFSVPNLELHRYYDGRYDLEILEHFELAGGLKGSVNAVETVHRLRPRTR